MGSNDVIKISIAIDMYNTCATEYIYLSPFGVAGTIKASYKRMS